MPLLAEMKYHEKKDIDLSEYLGSWQLSWCNGADDKSEGSDWSEATKSQRTLIITAGKCDDNATYEIVITENGKKILQTETADEKEASDTKEGTASWKGKKFIEAYSGEKGNRTTLFVIANKTWKDLIQNGEMLEDMYENSFNNLSLTTNYKNQTVLHWESNSMFTNAISSAKDGKTYHGPRMIQSRHSYCHFVKIAP